MNANRRAFLRTLAGSSALAVAAPPRFLAASSASHGDAEIRDLIEAKRPSRLTRLPADFRDRIGATHVAGKYHLTDKPFLLEGAERLLELGTRLGKFYFSPGSAARDYPFNSDWPGSRDFAELARTDYYERLFTLPFSTFILQAHANAERGWKEDKPDDFYAGVTAEFYSLAAHLYKTLRDRPVTVVLQHWEGDWLLRGRGGEKWNPPPANWKKLCEQMQKWLGARQAGVSKAQRDFGAKAKCRVAHATEVNRVLDLWKGIPTMTEHVLPGVALDLISYSCYDAMRDAATLWKCLAEIKNRARTTGLYKNPVYLGEIGIPENDRPHRFVGRLDEFLGAALAAEVPFIVYWQLYCNELNPKLDPPPPVPVARLTDVRGFWLVRPDGSLGEAGQYFQGLWRRAG